MRESDLIDGARNALRNGQAATARQLGEQRLRIVPNDIDALEIIALAAQAQGDAIGAERGFRAILAIDTGARWARADLARLLIDRGRPGDAEAELLAALTRDPDFADGHALIGVLLAEREALVEAGGHFDRAIALAGRHPDLLVNRGRVHLRRGDARQALTFAAEVMAAAPRLLSAVMLAADAAEQSGDLATAARLLDRAEPLARAQGTDVTLARARLLGGGAEWREGLAMLDREPQLSGAARLLRGRLREKAQRFDEAWRDFVAGKAALARSYDRAEVDGLLARLRETFRPDAPSAPVRPDIAQPIFILGPPRSGTTMIEQVLAAHPQIRPGGELPFVAELASAAEKLERAPSEAALVDLRDHYLARATAFGLTGPGAAFFTDKMPLNEVYLPLIRQVFPQAPLILLRRHPLDVLVSAMSHDMTHGFHAFYDPANAAHYLAATAGLVDHWSDALGIRPHVLRYEQFVADPRGETARLMAHLGLTPDAAQANFHTLDRTAPTPSYAQVREPVHGRSVDRWRAFAPMLAPFIPILAERIATEGYSI